MIFALQNRGLKQNISLLLMNNEILQANDIAKPIKAFDIDSNKVDIHYNSSKRTVLYIFSTHCEPCKINIPNWIQLTTKMNNDIQVIGISLDPVSEIRTFAQKNSLNFKVYATVGMQFKIDYKAFSTPQTVIINNDGIVIGAYSGVLNKINVPKILADLSIRY